MSEERRLDGSATRDIDQLFVSFLEELTEITQAEVRAVADRVFDFSGTYLSERVQKALQDFRGLYFGGDRSGMVSERINQDVDHLLDEMMARCEAGENLGDVEDTFTMDEPRDVEGLGLAAVNRDLARLVNFEEGVKEMLMPVFYSMQFEELVCQRLDHILDAWKRAVETGGPTGDINTDHLAWEITAVLSSGSEKELFYRRVQGEEPPEGTWGMVPFCLNHEE